MFKLLIRIRAFARPDLQLPGIGVAICDVKALVRGQRLDPGIVEVPDLLRSPNVRSAVLKLDGLLGKTLDDESKDQPESERETHQILPSPLRISTSSRKA